jgi:hypothetical protein
VIHVVVAFLVVSLAGRFLRTSSSGITTAQCNSPRAKIQHLAQDAFGWTVPTAVALPALAASSGDVIVPRDEPLPPLAPDGTLCDRAPPVS